MEAREWGGVVQTFGQKSRRDGGDYTSTRCSGVRPGRRRAVAQEIVALDGKALRRLALNLLKRKKTKRRGIKGKQLAASWNHAYLLRLLQN